jgi:hypothetical protein
MTKIFVPIVLTVLAWVSPARAWSEYQPEERPVARSHLLERTFSGAEGITPASAAFSIRFRSSGTFAVGKPGRRGFDRYGYNKFGKRGVYPHQFGYPKKFGYYRYGYRPFGPSGKFKRDPFFSDRYSRFYGRSTPGFSSPFYSPFGTRRPGW